MKLEVLNLSSFFLTDKKLQTRGVTKKLRLRRLLDISKSNLVITIKAILLLQVIQK